ncbi:MCE family protein [Amycolatopsis sp. K13G38]|uniref:MCE family protein n=1 Tax=Amycolatopsis acididurans TaxID=2724524 RepID=A0ABX1IYX3_9PSEU|nr:MCE family protein [Amycolatopsis acididurans]NKQ52713.1 MCE family protein [Amycolatopsis acididurans]
MRYRIAAAVVVVLLLAAGGLWYFRGTPALHVTAEFTQADGVFPGNKVTILGVPVGTVTTVTPEGGTVRVDMTLPADTQLPSTVEAWIVNPSVISEKYVELSAYRGGNTAGDAPTIPVQRTHAPLSWDQLSASLDTVLTALGPTAGQALHTGAALLDGNGQRVRDAVRDIAQASSLLGGHTGDITALLDSLDTLVRIVTDNKSTVDNVTREVGQAADMFDQQRDAIGSALSQLSDVLTRVAGLVHRQGQPLMTDLDRLTQLTNTILVHQRSLTEVLDTAPLAFGNFGRALTPDHRLRIRLDVSTNLSQFPAAQQLCEKFPIPLCSGPGVVNPIPFPPDVTSALGLGSVLGGGR